MTLKEIQKICDNHFFSTTDFTKNGGVIDIGPVDGDTMLVSCSYGTIRGNEFSTYQFTLVFKMNRNKFLTYYEIFTLKDVE